MNTWLGRMLNIVTGVILAKGALALPMEQPITLSTPTGELVGTLQPADRGGKMPVALLIAGSGPTDRDGNSPVLPGRNDSLKLLARELAEAGYASVRYDKRGIGASREAGPSESALRFETYVEDAVAWVGKLNGDERFSQTFIVGHSEGALIGMAASKKAAVSAFISLAGSADTAAGLLRKQLAGKLPPDLAIENERILSALESGKKADNIPAGLAVLYRDSVQPYLISWFKYVPSRIIASLKIPVLIVQGTSDIQVPAEQALALRAAKPDAAIAIIPGMNHALKKASSDRSQQEITYLDPEIPLHPGLMTHITAFLRQSLESIGIQSQRFAQKEE